MGSPPFWIFPNEVVVVMVVRSVALHNGFGICIQEGDAVCGGIDMLFGKGFARMLGLMEIVELLRVQKSDNKGVVFKEQGAAIHPSGESHGRVPLTEVLHKLPLPSRQRVGGLVRPQCSERQ